MWYTSALLIFSRSQADNAPLMTSSMRQAKLESSVAKYPYAIIRFYLPNKTVIQARFRPRETGMSARVHSLNCNSTISHPFACNGMYISLQFTPWGSSSSATYTAEMPSSTCVSEGVFDILPSIHQANIHTLLFCRFEDCTPPKQMLNDLSATLIEARLVPMAIIHVEFDNVAGITAGVTAGVTAGANLVLLLFIIGVFIFMYDRAVYQRWHRHPERVQGFRWQRRTCQVWNLIIFH